MNINEKFRKYSEYAKKAMQIGDFEALSNAYSLMAIQLHKEKKYVDEIKLRMLAFYFELNDISGKTHVSKVNVLKIGRAVTLAKIDEKESRDLYFDTIRNDTVPKHLMTLKGSYRLMNLLIEKKWAKADKIISNLRKNLVNAK